VLSRGDETPHRIASRDAKVTSDHTLSLVPSTSSPTSTATTANQTRGGVPAADSRVKPAIPTIEPPMSIAYARNGGMLLSSGPSGMASAAMIAATNATTRISTSGLVSAAPDSASPKNSSLEDTSSMLSWERITIVTTANSSTGNATSDQRAPRRPSRMPRPMPRKLAISRKLLKKPT
jgi:hypothetical protein